MTGRRHARGPACAVLALAVVWATSAHGGPGPRTFKVTIAQMAFGPTPSGARTGDVVEWVNADIFRHTATARNGAFDVDLAPKAHARTVLRKPGEVAFYCRYHPGMTGKLEVSASGKVAARPPR